MEEKDTIICLKKRNKNQKNIKKKNYRETEKLFHSIKMEEEVVHFGENSMIKSAFRKNKILLILTR